MEVKSKLREIRTQNKVSQEKLAAEVKISRKTIYLIEKGERTPSLEAALLIARFFEKSVEDIFSLFHFSRHNYKI